jgi:uncharacterized membrane protein
MTQRTWWLVILVVGIVVTLLSVFADALGVGRTPGFGWKQSLGVLIGVVLIGLGLWRRR